MERKTDIVYVGVDNGVTGSIGVLHPKFSLFQATPVKTHRKYTIEEHYISRIDMRQLYLFFDESVPNALLQNNLPGDLSMHFFLERPMTNPGRFAASISAARAWEVWLILIESYRLPYTVIDSKKWQKTLLGKARGSALKTASRELGVKLYPEHKKTITKTNQSDADGLLIAHWAMNNDKKNNS